MFAEAGGKRLVLRTDLQDSRGVFEGPGETVPGDLFSRGPASLVIGPTTRVGLPPGGRVADPTYYAGLRNLFRLVGRGVNPDVPVKMLRYFGDSRVETTSQIVVDEVKRQLTQHENIVASNAGQFAHSAYYMGSKRALGAFLAEAIRSTLSKRGMVVDFMCGSGAASGAFCRLWPTVASDAQHFSRVLATIQGGGYRGARAEARLDGILGAARENTKLLRSAVGDALSEEDVVFHGDLDESALQRYRDFVTDWPTYPSGRPSDGWDPVAEAERRRREPHGKPYCLFTAYFANVYFGLRQSVEIDGLRFGVEQLGPEDRTWALGALVASVSALGSTFGGHFAQPPIRRADDLNIGNLGRLLERRAASVTHEFCARYLSLAAESERAMYPVRTVLGPWREALDTVQRMASGGQEITVYVDAPYTREEYSRYYHPLETLVEYGVPRQRWNWAGAIKGAGGTIQV